MVKGTTATVETGRKSGKLFRKQEEVQSKRAQADHASSSFFSAEGSFFKGVQSKCATCESEGEVQAQFIPAIQRVEASDDIQRQSETGVEEAVQRAAQEPEIQNKCADCAPEEAEPTIQTTLQRSPEEEDVEFQRQPEEVQEKPQLQAASAECAAESIQPAEIPTSAVPNGVQASLKVGAPNDRYEQEADQMGEWVMRMPDTQFSSGEGIVPSDTGSSIRRQEEDEPADVQGKMVQRTPGLQRAPSGGLQTTTGFAGRLQSSLSGGSALGAPVQQGMESAFNADFSRVQIHTGPSAASLSNEIGAKAFTYQNHVFFNEGNYQPETQSGRFLLAHELTHTVQQGAAVKRSEASTPDVQASWFDDALSWLSGFSDHIPGYSLLKVLIGQDIFTGQSVPMTAENLVRGIFGLLGTLGHLVYDKLAEYQIIQDAFTWLRGQLRTLNINMSRIREIIQAAWDEMPVLNVPGLLYRHFNPLVDDIRTFASNTVDQVIQLLKDALVSVLKAMAIDRLPAYRLLTKILHRDPLTGEEVPATTVEILEDFLRMINANDELEQMRERGTLQKTADWIDEQMGQFMSLIDELGGIFQRIWALFSLETLSDIVGKLEEIITAFTSFVQRVFTFASNVAITVLQFIKDSLLNWLRTHANGIRGYHLMTVLLGKDPVTDQVVERNARNILSGFVELVAGPEKFQEIEQSGAIGRMAAWLEGLIARTGITLQMVIDLFVGIWNSLTIQDLIHPLDAFERVITKFRDPIQRVLTFIVEVIKKVVEIVLELMQFPSELIAQIIQRAMAAIEDIQRDPLGFLKNLLGAMKLGLQQFFGNIGTHLLNGLSGWLFAELQQAGITPPQDFSLRSIVGFVFEVLNISMERIWQKLAEHPQIGPERVARVRQFIETASGAVEGAWAFIQDIQREGISAIWRHIQEQLANLWNTVLESVQNWVMEQVVNGIMRRLITMLDPTGIMAIINGAMAFYQAVKSFIERLREILEVINSFVGGIAEIARGSLATAANYLEGTMARSVPVVIGFLANQVPLRGLGARIGDMVGRVREMVDQGLTWLVNKAVTMGRRLMDRLMGRGGDEAQSSDVQEGRIQKPLRFANESHSISVEMSGNIEFFMASSTPLPVMSQLVELKRHYIEGYNGQGGHLARQNQPEALEQLDRKIEEIRLRRREIIGEHNNSRNASEKQRILEDGLDELEEKIETMSSYMLDTFSEAFGGATDVSVQDQVFVINTDRYYQVTDVRVIDRGRFGFRASSQSLSESNMFFPYEENERTWRKAPANRPRSRFVKPNYELELNHSRFRGKRLGEAIRQVLYGSWFADTLRWKQARLNTDLKHIKNGIVYFISEYNDIETNPNEFDDKDGRRLKLILPTRASIDHTTPVATHWNQDGNNQNQNFRQNWYNNYSSGNLKIISTELNSSLGARNDNYNNITKENFTGPDEV
ncbi:DUF4157 domain-containing protein [Haliscomenobacter sp.]|uniref:eCIS core domain-containing protein n=1 Tax=Haliscomenobacter sp. TaxID=2717303 RepID=UPI0035947108